MTISGFQRMQVEVIVKHLHKHPPVARVEMFKMIMEHFCLLCGAEKKKETIYCGGTKCDGIGLK